MTAELNRLTILRLFFFLSALISGVVLVLLLLWRSEAESTVVFAYSAGRLISAGVVAMAALSMFWLALMRPKRHTAEKILSHLDQWLVRPGIATIVFYAALLACILGIAILTSLPHIQTAIFYPSLIPFIPFMWWLFGFGCLALIGLSLLSHAQSNTETIAIIILILILIAGAWVHTSLWETRRGDPTELDIFSVFREGARLYNSTNPYERVLAGNLAENADYATYLPVIYILSWLTRAAGLSVFSDWLALWQVIFLIFNLLIASALFLIPFRQRITVFFAVFAACFWLFNRWSADIAISNDYDFIPIFFLILSVTLFDRHRLLSCLLLGLSIGLKHLSIFLLPVYLIWVWKESNPRSIKPVLSAGLAVIGIPLLVSLPFIVWNWRGFILSILFSVTRNPSDTFEALSIDALLGWSGLPARIFLLGMIGLVYIVAWKEKVSRYLAALLFSAIIVDFNSVLYSSYFAWVVPFMLLSASELLLLRKERGTLSTKSE